MDAKGRAVSHSCDQTDEAALDRRVFVAETLLKIRDAPAPVKVNDREITCRWIYDPALD
jgi:hypothetical protein